MSNIISMNIDGKVVNVDVDAFKEYNAEALQHLRDEEEAKANFKYTVEAVSESTGLEKPVVSAYFKARFADKTDAAIEKGNLFDALDKAMEG